MTRSQRRTSWMLFAALTLLFGVMAAWLLRNNFTNEAALLNWSTLKAVFDADTLRLENIGFAHPYGPMLLLAPFHFLPWVGAAGPFIVSVVVIALLLTLWYRHLTQGGYSTAQRALLLLLLLVHPAILWGATTGGSEAIALLMFYLLYRACLRMIYESDIRSFIAIGLVLAAFFYFNVISVFIFVALLPLLVLIVPIRLLRESPLSVYVIIGTPLLIILGAWIYFNWIFLGEPLAFLHTYESGFAGAKSQAETVAWLRAYGGEFVIPTLLGMGYVLFGYPVLLFLLLRSYGEGRQLRISLVLMFHPVLSIGLATLTYYLASPLQITVLIAASVMAEISRMACLKSRCMVPLVLLLLLGNATSWYLFVQDGFSHVKPWSTALLHEQTPTGHGDRALGHWLAEHREPTLLDLKSGYRVVAARGDAVGLLLPFTPEYRLAMRSERPTVPQIAVPDPDSATGRRDAINARFPALYASGLPGYQRVYDENGWRVYRRSR